MPPSNPFIELTAHFNAGRLRAIVCSGQAVVLHRLAMMSKDGDWIVRESEEDLAHVRAVLARHRARYRYGAPLDARWLAGGWSAHLEYRTAAGLRVRTDFFSRAPRLSAAELAALWREQEGASIPFVGLRELALMKMTQREKDYPIIGELARRLTQVEDQLRLSRSPHDLIDLAREHPREAAVAVSERPLLTLAIAAEPERLAAALDAERRHLMRADAARLATYEHAATRWAAAWPGIDARLGSLPLEPAHAILCQAALEHLPFSP
jgi:hypothetical protein